MPEPIAFVECTDGLLRPVFEEPGGRQYVMDDDGEPVYGVWFISWEECDLPLIVEARP